MTDPNALNVFIYCLLMANSKGEGRVSRHSTSKFLEMNPSTFRDAFARLEEKYNLTTSEPTGRFTRYSLKNWSKYQTLNDRSDDNATTMRRQCDDTINKNKNKNKKYITCAVFESDEVQKKTEDEVKKEAKRFLKGFNEIKDTNYRSIKGFFSNYLYWRESYHPREMLQAVAKSNSTTQDFYLNITPTILFRQSNKKGSCDYIGDLLALKTGKDKINQVAKAMQ